MHAMTNFSKTLLLLSFSSLALTNPAPTPITTVHVTASDLPSLVSKMSSYVAQVTTEAKFSSVMSILSTALPESISDLLLDNMLTNDDFTSASWYTAMPSDARSYMSSVDSAQLSIMTAKATPSSSNSKNAAVETGVPRAMVGVVGALGAAVLMM